eukprot:TRINITY_DN12625_c0_g1_i2.p3 TRINITY_DN12625_c0_g1~~TRINITY_DN12625_c0_g1_i2.p3  ORF type:complete len:127 (-),score=18.09 TRINITY_DN12625_c0_g1_i2:18-398(-)
MGRIPDSGAEFGFITALLEDEPWLSVRTPNDNTATNTNRWVVDRTGGFGGIAGGPSGTGIRPGELQVNDEVRVTATASGGLEIRINGELRFHAAEASLPTDAATPLWGVVGLMPDSTLAIKRLDTS